MKATRRSITMALALALILAMAIPAFAEATTGGTIIITGTSGISYTVYKMFDVIEANADGQNKYKTDGIWNEFVVQEDLEDYFSLQIAEDGNYVIWLKDSTSAADAAAIAQLARTFVNDNSGNNGLNLIDTVQVGDVEGLDVSVDGYYLLIPSDTSVSGVIVVKGGADVTIKEKTVEEGMPTIEKKVREDSTLSFGDSNTVDIGQTFTYRINITAGEGASNYVLHDVMDTHIAMKPATLAITRNGNAVLDGEYDFLTENLCEDEGCTFHIVFDPTWCSTLTEGAVISITYDATLLYKDASGSLTETDIAHENTAWLTHTEQEVETARETVSTLTHQINVLKVDQKGTALAGAGFVLRDNEKRYYKVTDILDDNLEVINKVVSWVTDIEEATEVVSDADGKVQFYGVDAEVFYLDEKTVPGGYTGVDGTQANTTKGSVAVTIKNVLGQALPETGGIGTTVFYIAGIVLVLGALTALVIIKRKETSAQ